MRASVDPGVNGALAIDVAGTLITYKNKTLSFLDRVKLLQKYKKDGGETILIERQWVKPAAKGGGGISQGNKASWVLSADYTTWLNAAQAADIKIKLIAPQVWERCIGELSRDYQVRKRQIKEIVVSYFDNIKVTLWNCDALALWFHFDYLLTVAKDYDA